MPNRDAAPLKHVEYNKNQVSIMLYVSSIISGIILGFLGDAQKHNTRIFEHNVSDPNR